MVTPFQGLTPVVVHYRCMTYNRFYTASRRGLTLLNSLQTWTIDYV